MPTQFEATTKYLGKEITVKTDNFKSLHQTLAKVDELNRDANFLAKKSGASSFAVDFRSDAEGNEYYGVSVKGSRESVTFGQLREGGLIPFFPKGEDGYYDGQSRSRGGGGGYGGGQQQAPPQQNGGQRQQAPRPQQPQQQGGGQQEYQAEADNDALPFS